MFKSGVNKKSLLLILFSVSIILLLILTMTLPAYAHRVISHAYIEGKEIVVEGAFGNGNPVKDCKVTVYDAQDKVVYEGTTNSNGICKFKAPKKSTLKVILDTGTGHRSESIIKEESLPKVKSENEFNGNKENSSNQKMDQVNESIEESVENNIGVSEDKLRKIIQEEVSKELSGQLSKDISSIKRSLVRLEKKNSPGVVEILGGLGYIMGLMGIAFYFKAKGDEES